MWCDLKVNAKGDWIDGGSDCKHMWKRDNEQFEKKLHKKLMTGYY